MQRPICVTHIAAGHTIYKVTFKRKKFLKKSNVRDFENNNFENEVGI